MKLAMNMTQVAELLLQSLEHERGGVKIYKAAVACARRPDLKQEWLRYLTQTEQHVVTLTEVCAAFDLDPRTTTPGTRIVQSTGMALYLAIEAAHAAGDPQAAQIVAAECIVLAETKDHLDWELLSEVARALTDGQRAALTEACERIVNEEDQHLYSTQGWARELWLEALGLEAELPPDPERRAEVAAAEARLSHEPHPSRH